MGKGERKEEEEGGEGRILLVWGVRSGRGGLRGMVEAMVLIYFCATFMYPVAFRFVC